MPSKRVANGKSSDHASTLISALCDSESWRKFDDGGCDEHENSDEMINMSNINIFLLLVQKIIICGYHDYLQQECIKNRINHYFSYFYAELWLVTSSVTGLQIFTLYTVLLHKMWLLTVLTLPVICYFAILVATLFNNRIHLCLVYFGHALGMHFNKIWYELSITTRICSSTGTEYKTAQYYDFEKDIWHFLEHKTRKIRLPQKASFWPLHSPLLILNMCNWVRE